MPNDMQIQVILLPKKKTQEKKKRKQKEIKCENICLQYSLNEAIRTSTIKYMARLRTHSLNIASASMHLIRDLRIPTSH